MERFSKEAEYTEVGPLHPLAGRFPEHCKASRYGVQVPAWLWRAFVRARAMLGAHDMAAVLAFCADPEAAESLLAILEWNPGVDRIDSPKAREVREKLVSAVAGWTQDVVVVDDD